MFDNDDNIAAPRFQMTDREIVMAASLTLTSIAGATFELLRHSASIEFDLGAIDLCALLCFPDTFPADPEKARGWVTEILNVLRDNDES